MADADLVGQEMASHLTIVRKIDLTWIIVRDRAGFEAHERALAGSEIPFGRYRRVLGGNYFSIDSRSSQAVSRGFSGSGRTRTAWRIKRFKAFIFKSAFKSGAAHRQKAAILIEGH